MIQPLLECAFFGELLPAVLAGHQMRLDGHALLSANSSRRRRPAAVQSPHSFSPDRRRSSQFSQLTAQFARCAEERILYGLFAGAKGGADGAQLESLVMLHFKHDAFRGESRTMAAASLARFPGQPSASLGQAQGDAPSAARKSPSCLPRIARMQFGR